MKTTSLLYFELKLCISLISFIWELVKIRLGKQRFILVGSSIVAATSILLFIVLSTKQKPQATSLVTEYTPPQSSMYVQKEMTEEEIQRELHHWLSVLEEQPSHRDVLINVSNLYRTLGDESNAIYYWEKARKADPNNPLFK